LPPSHFRDVIQRLRAIETLSRFAAWIGYSSIQVLHTPTMPAFCFTSKVRGARAILRVALHLNWFAQGGLIAGRIAVRRREASARSYIVCLLVVTCGGCSGNAINAKKLPREYEAPNVE